MDAALCRVGDELHDIVSGLIPVEADCDVVVDIGAEDDGYASVTYRWAIADERYPELDGDDGGVYGS